MQGGAGCGAGNANSKLSALVNAAAAAPALLMPAASAFTSVSVSAPPSAPASSASASAVIAAGELVLWGVTLWDPRVPAPLHTFDQLSSNAGGAGGIFHPNGAEIILNSEVSRFQGLSFGVSGVCRGFACVSGHVGSFSPHRGGSHSQQQDECKEEQGRGEWDGSLCLLVLAAAFMK